MVCPGESDSPTTGEAIDLPVHLLVRGGRSKRELDAQALVALLSRPLAHAFVEQAGAMPRQGVSSAFAFGKCFGIVLGVLAAVTVEEGAWRPKGERRGSIRALGIPTMRDLSGAVQRKVRTPPEPSFLMTTTSNRMPK
jgi:hypothetical protein